MHTSTHCAGAPAAPIGARRTPTTAAHGAALLRIALGIMWVAHALLKLWVFTLPGTAAYFAGIGLPGWLAYPVFATELLGGLALVLGIHTRQASLLLIPIVAGAALVHGANGWVHTSPGGGWEYPLFLVVASVASTLIGDGSFALRRAWQAVD